MLHEPGEELDIKIEKIIPRGFGLGFGDNLTVFVPLSAPGDRLRVRVREVKGKIAYADIVEVLEPSPERVEPACEYFGTCGGCDFQQMTYAAQLEAKVGIIRDCLHRIAKLDDVDDIVVIPSPHQFQYRSRAQWHYNTVDRRIGYYKRGSRDLVEIASCPKLTPELNDKLHKIRKEIQWENIWTQTGQIDAAHGNKGLVSVHSPEVNEPTAEITVTAGGETFLFSAKSFFQGNRYLIDNLIDTAIVGAKGGTALDLYCGVGLFAIPLARKFERVLGIEENSDAIGFARRSSEIARLENTKFHADNVKAFLAALNDDDPIDFVLLDPPRSGPEKRVISDIIRLRPAEISYVSCEPSILARDLRDLTAAGYKLRSLTAIDLFPQTHHIETVARLKR